MVAVGMAKRTRRTTADARKNLPYDFGCAKV
jgi:hypothetical protein